MTLTTEQFIQCPYCGEQISMIVDKSMSEQSYIEDCEVCCRPINIDLKVNEKGRIQIEARSENE